MMDQGEINERPSLEEIEAMLGNNFDVSYKGRAVKMGMLTSDRSYRVRNDYGDSFDVVEGQHVLARLNEVRAMCGDLEQDRWDTAHTLLKVEDKEGTGSKR